MRALSLARSIAVEFEGCHLAPYHCPAGYPTIGWGRLLSRKRWESLSRWQPISQDTADAYLIEDLRDAKKQMRRLVQPPLFFMEEAALIDFIYNLGAGAFQGSTLRRVINREEWEEVPVQLARWVYASGSMLPGLVRRREAEIDMWLSAC